MARDRHQSAGDVISSVTFFGVGLWVISNAFEAESLLKTAVLLTCGVLSLLAAFRFPIGRLAKKFWPTE